ncbi:MAG TPA: hypothetical protein VKB03_16460 [Conexibacter sp.]|nr:hypothetical protein [Conexibacter sp.]
MLAVLTLACAGGTAVARTYVPNCGTTYYLEYKPAYWSAGCTGGSPTMPTATWRRWGSHVARGTGTAQLRGPCRASCVDAKVYESSGRLSLYGTRRCVDGRGRRQLYFSRARFSVYFRAHNLFGYPKGWRTFPVFTTIAYQGECRLTQE